MMPKFRKKPVVIEAKQLTENNFYDILKWCNYGLPPEAQAKATTSHFGVQIHTLEGTHLARVGDFIIKGVQGEFYPCKPDIFAETYEPA